MRCFISKPALALGIFLISLSASAQINSATHREVSKREPAMGPACTFKTVLSPETNSCLSIKISNPQEKKLNLRIIHELTGVVVDTTIDSKWYACRYHFDNAADGIYRIVVRNGKEKFRKNILLGTETTVSRNLRIE